MRQVLVMRKETYQNTTHQTNDHGCVSGAQHLWALGPSQPGSTWHLAQYKICFWSAETVWWLDSSSKSGQFSSLWSSNPRTSNLAIFSYIGEKEFKAPCPSVPDLDYLSPCVQALPRSRVHAFVVTKIPFLETSLTPSYFPSFQVSPVKTLQFLGCISPQRHKMSYLPWM